MLLRSSSAPVLGSLLPSFSESHNRDLDNNNNKSIHPSSCDHSYQKKISFSHGRHSSFSSFSLNSSPISHSFVGSTDLDREISSPVPKGFQRARSDGNLEGLAAASCDINEFHKNPIPRSSHRHNNSMLETIPSFSIYNSIVEYEDEDDKEQEVVEEKENLSGKDAFLERSVTIGDSIIAIGGDDFNFEKNNMGLIEEGEEQESLSEFCISGAEEEREPASPPLYLARGLGIDMIGFGGLGGGGDIAMEDSGENSSEGSNVEEHYKRMAEENPSNPLFLRNYAQFLYQSKGDLRGAEEYYSRAILADPRDGEILSRYAKLVWELHHDHERASSYFEQAVQAAPQDSQVLAAYASFLWETEDNEEEDNMSQDLVRVSSFHGGAVASATA